eukprot:6269904-Alexandrium_andersonii.AAC.1
MLRAGCSARVQRHRDCVCVGDALQNAQRITARTVLRACSAIATAIASSMRCKGAQQMTARTGLSASGARQCCVERVEA